MILGYCEKCEKHKLVEEPGFCQPCMEIIQEKWVGVSGKPYDSHNKNLLKHVTLLYFMDPDEWNFLEKS